MQPVESDVIAIGELIEDPEDTVHFKSHGSGQLAKPSVAGQKGPFSRLCDSKCKCVGGGQIRALPPDRRCATKLHRRQHFDAKPKCDEPISKVPGKLSNKEQVGDRKLKREAKQILKQIPSFQINQNRGVRDEDGHFD